METSYNHLEDGWHLQGEWAGGIRHRGGISDAVVERTGRGALSYYILAMHVFLARDSGSNGSRNSTL